MRKEKRGFRDIITNEGGRANWNVPNNLQQDWALFNEPQETLEPPLNHSTSLPKALRKYLLMRFR